MQDLFARLRELWNAASTANRTLLVGTIAAALCVGIGFTVWASRPEYVQLVQDPAPSEMTQILAYLKDNKVEYQIGSGNTIYVPESKKNELRMKLTGLGLLRTGNLGYGLLDKMPLTATKEQERITILRATEGELENTIQTISQVASAKVKIAEEQKSGFVTDDATVSASVLVQVKPGCSLDKQNVRAIVSLVSRAKAGLSDKGVSVVDGEGNLLWDGSQLASNGASGDDRLERERAFKESLSRDIQTNIVQKVAGANKSAVVVRAVLNLDQQQKSTTEYTKGVPSGVESSDEKYVGGSNGADSTGPAGGPPGMASNGGGAAEPPVYAGNKNNGTGKTMTSSKSVTPMQNNETKTQTTITPGEVKNLSIAILLDKEVDPTAVTAIKNQAEILARTYLPEGTTAPLVSVEQVPFDKSGLEADKKAAEAGAAAERMAKLMGYGVPIALMLAMLFILARSLKRTPITNLVALPGQQPMLAMAGAGGAGGGLDLAIGGGVESRDPTGMSVEEALERERRGPMAVLPDDIDEHQYQIIQEAFDADLASIGHLAQEKPEIIAVLIRTWLAEDKR
jgi:flagellar M-ring protein FliF